MSVSEEVAVIRWGRPEDVEAILDLLAHYAMGLPILAYSPAVQILSWRSFRAFVSGAWGWVAMRLRPPRGRVLLLCQQKTDMPVCRPEGDHVGLECRHHARRREILDQRTDLPTLPSFLAFRNTVVSVTVPRILSVRLPNRDETFGAVPPSSEHRTSVVPGLLAEVHSPFAMPEFPRARSLRS